MEQQINEKIIEIVHQVNDMIPVEWDDLYIVIEMDKTYSGGAYFFFKSLNEYQYFLDIPSLYSLSSEVFDKEYDILFEKAQELKKIFLENDQADWYFCIIHLDESNKLSVDFDYAPWLESGYGPSSRMDLFEYKYLGKQPANEKELEKFKAMEAFQREHNQK
ncbi:antitoxin YezG family protein [Streptococcus oralis]|uniref:immunity protein YezG family protein n=1 Tax=Streptococcus oralis TaxID=1303 RepID=UPI001F60FDD3|nr:immunity protein YezG family protein [Streptococcus oralis]UNV67194.1 antitoxin YezG family protein [Streptococcus oralis]